MAKKFDLGNGKTNKRTLQVTLNATSPADHYVFDLHRVLVMKRATQEEKVESALWGLRWKTTVVNALRVHVDMLRGIYDALKEFHPEIYKAVELLQSFQRGDMSLLEVMFPALMEKYRLRIERDLLEKTHDENQHDIMLKLVQIQNRLDVLDDIQNQIKTPQLPAPVTPPVSNGIKPIVPIQASDLPRKGSSNAVAPDPVFEDDDNDNIFLVKKDDDAGLRASQNYIQSLDVLQKYNWQTDEVVQRKLQAKNSNAL